MLLGYLLTEKSSPTAATKFLPLSTIVMSSLSQTTTISMDSQPNSRRPTCPNCVKPISLCLCTRIITPNLDNKIHVTILQHSLEKKHPLNSAKIAKLGLRNVDVFTVTDVNFEAQFEIRLLEEVHDECGFDLVKGGGCTPHVCRNASERLDFDGGLEINKSRKRVFGQVGELDYGVETGLVSDFEQLSDCSDRSIDEIGGFECSCGGSYKENGSLLMQSDVSLMGNHRKKPEEQPSSMRVTFRKKGKVTYINHQLKVKDGEKTDNNELVISIPEAIESFAGGFVVKKIQQKQKTGCVELEQVEEFEITVPSGSVVLFPAQDATPISTIDFEVKNLIVLDGSWAKGKRMYAENPWLKLLPSVRLNVEKPSRFCEVRREPKPGYLSTVESIVYALKAFGVTENSSGLDNLLEVLESMVEDQRRCKDERLQKLSLA